MHTDYVSIASPTHDRLNPFEIDTVDVHPLGDTLFIKFKANGLTQAAVAAHAKARTRARSDFEVLVYPVQSLHFFQGGSAHQSVTLIYSGYGVLLKAQVLKS